MLYNAKSCGVLKKLPEHVRSAAIPSFRADSAAPDPKNRSTWTPPRCLPGAQRGPGPCVPARVQACCPTARRRTALRRAGVAPCGTWRSFLHCVLIPQIELFVRVVAPVAPRSASGRPESPVPTGIGIVGRMATGRHSRRDRARLGAHAAMDGPPTVWYPARAEHDPRFRRSHAHL